MFYSTITPNIFFDLLTAVGWVGLGLLLLTVLGGLLMLTVLKMGLLALGRTQEPPLERMSLDEFEGLFTKDGTSAARERARDLHPAGKGR